MPKLVTPTPDTLSRVVKLFMDSGDAQTVEEAEALLAGYAVNVWIGKEASRNAAAQAALLTAVATGARALPGGVFVSGEIDVPLKVAIPACRSLEDAVRHIGGKTIEPSAQDLPWVYVGNDPAPVGRSLIEIRCLFDGWRGGVVPATEFSPIEQGTPTELAGVLAGAISISEIFQSLRGGFAMAGRRSLGLSLWQPDLRADWRSPDPGEPLIRFLPSDLWVLGLGHLGQAYLWVLGLQPYRDPSQVRLVLQDFDTLTVANQSTSVLTTPSMIHERKTRAMAKWAESRGFRTDIVERRFGEGQSAREDEPPILLSGVDNALARAALGEVKTARVIDAGLGAGPEEYLALRVQTFPGSRTPRQVWGGLSAVPRDLPLHQPAYKHLRSRGIDDCGLTLLAERTVGAPFVGVSAATLVIAELLRDLHGGARYELIDLTLRSPADRYAVRSATPSRSNLGFAMAKDCR